MSNTKPNSLDAQLLIDLQRYFAEQPATHYPTEQLLNYLAGIHAAPWATFNQGKPITARHLARLLQPYGIKPRNLWQAGAVAKGYKVTDFADAFADSIADNLADVADNLADKVVDKVNVADNLADNLADNPSGIADNLADNPSGIAANVVTMTRTAVTTTDHLAVSVPARPTRKWPPPKGWAWNHQTGDYEPPKPTVQSEPMDQETIRQTLHVDPSLQYLPGKGLVALHEAEIA